MSLELYNKVRAVPKEALKEIGAGRLKGKSDINPMWRIKTLTEHFGPCGIGWYYEITRQWLEQGANGEIAGFCNINLYIKVGDEWSKPIQGTGGSSFIAREKNGPYTSDEVYKMALTDAISVACKALGFGANVYWDKDRTKYDLQSETATVAKPAPAPIVTADVIRDFAKCNDRDALVATWNKYKDTDYKEIALNELRKRKQELGIEK